MAYKTINLLAGAFVLTDYVSLDKDGIDIVLPFVEYEIDKSIRLNSNLFIKPKLISEGLIEDFGFVNFNDSLVEKCLKRLTNFNAVVLSDKKYSLTSSFIKIHDEIDKKMIEAKKVVAGVLDELYPYISSFIKFNNKYNTYIYLVEYLDRYTVDSYLFCTDKTINKYHNDYMHEIDLFMNYISTKNPEVKKDIIKMHTGISSLARVYMEYNAVFISQLRTDETIEDLFDKVFVVHGSEITDDMFDKYLQDSTLIKIDEAKNLEKKKYEDLPRRLSELPYPIATCRDIAKERADYIAKENSEFWAAWLKGIFITFIWFYFTFIAYLGAIAIFIEHYASGASIFAFIVAGILIIDLCIPKINVVKLFGKLCENLRYKYVYNKIMKQYQIYTTDTRHQP